MKINLFSADLKLVQEDDPARRSFENLELNDGLVSGYEGFNSLGEGMISARVIPDYCRLFPDLQIVGLNGGEVENDGRRILFIPRTDGANNIHRRADLITAGRMGGLYQSMNADLHMSALATNKAYQCFMASKMGPENGALFPQTAILPTHFQSMTSDLADLGDCEDGFMLKPLTFSGGTGVRFIEADRLEKDLRGYLKHKRYSLRQPWVGLYDPACIVQHRVPPNRVETYKGDYDGTMRVVFTIYGGGTNLRCHIHDVYWKLPQEPMGAEGGPKSIISFSPSNAEAKEKKRDSADLLLSCFGFHSDSQLRRIHGAAVAQHIKDWLFPQFEKKMAGYFNFVSQSSHFKNTGALLNSDSSGQQALGLMMATSPHYYPVPEGEVISTHYPEKLVELIDDSKVIEGRRGYVFERFKMAARNRRMGVYCENPEREFFEPMGRIINQQGVFMMMAALHSVMR